MALPIDTSIDEILDHLSAHPNLVIKAPPGAGKTTRVPAALLDSGLIPCDRQILVLEPRRVAARAAARRIISMRGQEMGEEVGYQVRFENRTSARTRLAILTEGLLARRLVHDPALENVGAVFLDEFHERSLHTDLAMAFLREVQETVRPDLRIVVMSATLDPGPIARFLDGCPVVQAQGRSYPVELHWLDQPDDRPLPSLVASAVSRATGHDRDDGGDILVFLPGKREIRRTQDTLGPLFGRRMEILPLHGDLSAEAQDLALSRGPRRRIILATNIAETSLTIEGVTTVVDSGLCRILRHDPSRGMNRLDEVRIGRESADQRAGRAGRTSAGRAYRLWTRTDDSRLAGSTEPEIGRIDLAPAVLEVIGWAARDPSTFGWFEPPPRTNLERAVRLLRTLGAVEETAHRLTRLGRTLREFPLHPRVAACLVASHARGVLRRGALLAALVSERDIVRGQHRTLVGNGTGPSDLLRRTELIGSKGPDPVEPLEDSFGFNGSAGSVEVDGAAVRAVCRARGQLIDLARQRLGPSTPGPEDEESSLLRVLLAGFPDRVCKRRPESGDRAVMVGGRGVLLANESVVREAPIFLAIEVKDTPAKAESLVRIASAVEELWLEEDTGNVTKEDLARFNEARESVETVRQRRYLDLILSESPWSQADPVEISSVLARAASRDPLRALRPDQVASDLLLRVSFLRRTCVKLDFPDLAGAGLIALIEKLSVGRRSFAELREVDLVREAKTWLGHRFVETLDLQAPERLTVPSGSRIRLRYESEGPPVLSVRLQEVFGLTDTPRVAGGTVPVKMELLSPSNRPVQITQDLASFWADTYVEVRKDLRARYPRHAWPEDPSKALPERRPVRRRGRSL